MTTIEQFQTEAEVRRAMKEYDEIYRAPYPSESWDEIADHQLTYDPTPYQQVLQERRR